MWKSPIGRKGGTSVGKEAAFVVSLFCSRDIYDDEIGVVGTQVGAYGKALWMNGLIAQRD